MRISCQGYPQRDAQAARSSAQSAAPAPPPRPTRSTRHPRFRLTAYLPPNCSVKDAWQDNAVCYGARLAASKAAREVAISRQFRRPRGENDPIPAIRAISVAYQLPTFINVGSGRCAARISAVIRCLESDGQLGKRSTCPSTFVSRSVVEGLPSSSESGLYVGCLATGRPGPETR